MSQAIERCLSHLQEEPTSALALYGLGRALIDANPEDVPAALAIVGAAREALRERGEIALYARALAIEASLYGEAREGLDVYRALAQLYQEELAEESEASRCYQQIQLLEPKDEEALEFIEDQATKQENWSRLAKKFTDEAGAAQAKDLAAQLYVRAAQLHYAYAPSFGSAESLLTRALEVDPKNYRAQHLLGRILEQQDRWPERLSLGRAQADAAATRDQKARGYLNAAALSLDAGILGEARNLVGLALKLEPTNLEALYILSEAAESDGAQVALVEAYEAALKARPRSDVERKLLASLGALKWRLGDQNGAEEVYRRLRKSDPAHPGMLSFYEAYYEQRNDFKETLNLLSTAHKVARDERLRLQLAERMADVAEHRAGQVEKAIEMWKWVQRQNPGHAEANRSLRRLYRVTGKWNALLELIKEEIDGYSADEPERKIARYLEMVEIYRGELRLDMMVINTYNAILALDPKNSHALDSLAHTYEVMNRWQDLIAVLGRRAEIETEPEVVASLWRRAAKLWIDKLSNLNQAVQPLERLLEIQPKDAEAISLLKGIYQKRRNYRALVQLGKKEVELFSDPLERRQLLIELAELAGQRLDRPRQAIAFWNRVLEMDQLDAKALDALEALYEKERRFPALIEIYRRKLEIALNDEARINFLQKVAALWADKLERVDRAVEVWRRILDIEPGHARAHRALRETFIKRGDFDALADLFARNESWDEYLQVLQSAADRTDAAEEKIGLFRRIAVLCDNQLHRPDQAARAHERILSIDPRNRESALALRPYYRSEARWPRLVAVLEILLSYEEGEGALPVLEALRQTSEERLEDKPAAFDYQRRAFLLSPYDAGLRETLERLALAAKAQNALYQTYQRVLPTLQDASLSLEITRRLAQLAEESESFDAALSRWEEVRAARPDEREALESLSRLYARAGRSEDLLGVLRARADLAEPDERLELMTRAVDVLETILQDDTRAIDTLREILSEFPEHLGTLRSLERLLQRQERYPELVEVLVRQLPVLRHIDATEGLVDALCALGQLSEEKLGQRDDAISYFRDALTENPACAPAVAALESMLSDEDRRLTVAEIIEPYYRATHAHQKLSQALEIRAAHAEGHERVALLVELAGIYELQLSDEEAAFDAFRRALALSPEDEEIAQQLGRLAAGLSRYEEYAASLDSAAEASDPGSAVRLYTALAPIYEEGLEKPEEARRVWRRVLEIEPEREDAFAALARLLDAAKAYPELLALLEDRITRATSDEARRALLFRKASIEEHTLGDVNRAIETYVEVRSISQYDAQAVSALERLYQSTERWRDYAALLEDELVGAGTPDARANVLCRLADVSVSRLGDASGAVDRLASALEEKPQYPPAVAALEKLLSTPEEQLRIARLLESCYAEAQQHAKLVGVLELQFSLLRAEPEAPELLQRIAELQEQQLQSPQAAYQAWRRAFLLNAEDERARGELERLAAQLSAQADLALVYSHLLSQGEHPLEDHLRASFLQREAELSEEPLGDIDRAISRWRDLAELDPAHRPALDALERLYLNKEDWTNLDDTLVRKVRAAGSIEEEAELWHQIGEIRRDYLSSAEGAIQAYREALSLNASDRRAIAALKTLYRGQSLHRELVELLTQELDLGGQDGSGSTEARLPLLYEIAEVFEKHLQDQEQAISSYNALLAEAPAERKAMQSLDRLYEATEQHNELLDLLDREFEASQDAQERVLFRFRQGKIFEGKLLDNERAIDRYEEVLQANPAHLGAREALEALLSNEDTAQRSARVLEPVYRRAHDVPRLVAALELIGDRSDEPGERVVRYREAASHCEQDLGEPKRAFELLSKALKVEPGDDTLWVALDRLAPRAGGPKAVAQLLREVVDEATDPDLKVKLHLKLAELCRVDLRDLEGAESNYLKALEDDPQNAVALGALESLYEGVGRWRDLIEVLRRRIDGALDAAAQIPLWHRVAKLWETRKNFDEAIDAYEQILNIEPEERGALDALDGLYAAQGRWPDLLSLLERRLELVSSLPERVALRTRMADLHLTRTEDSSRALDEARAILREDPRNESSLSLLERLFEVPEQRIEVSELLEPLYARRLEWHKLARLLELRLEDDQSPEERRQLATRLWMVREEQLEDLEGAFSALALLFREDPTDAQVRSRLSRFAELLNKWEDLAKALAVVAEDPGLAGDSGPSLCSDLAHIYEERLGRPEEAIPYLRQIVQDPNLGEEAAHTLEVLFRRLERWEDLFGLYQERAESAWEPQLQKELLRKGARLLENVIKDNDRAISVYQRILDIEEGDAQANEALDRLLSAESRWRDLVEYYLRRIDAIGDDPQVIELKFRLGQVYWQKLDELEPALDCYQDIIARVGDHEGAVFALEAIAKSPGLRRRAAEILEPIYEARGDWQKRIGLAESLLEIEEDATEKIELLTKVARLWENEGRAARRAFDAYLRAYALDLGAPNLRSELERLARGLGTWAELVQVTEAGIDGVSDSVTQGELLVEIGRIYEQELHNAPRATVAFERALSQDDSAEPVLDALDRLYEQSARHEDLARILSKKAELALSDDVRKRLYQRLALLSETAREDNEAAITAWREVLTLDPADPGANQNLERLYNQEKRNEDLAELYRQQLDQASNGEERRAVRFKLAQVQRDALNDPRAAIETFREVQNEFPDDLDALSALDALYTSEEQHAELLEVLERERALLTDEARVEIGLRMGDLLRGPLSEGERAISVYQEVLQESPQHPRARAALEQIAQDATLREAAAEVLAPLYQSANDLEAQRSLYELRLEGLDDKPRRRELLLELARLCTEGLGDPKSAFDAYCRALKEDLGDEELSSIAERQARVCARILPSWETLAQVYEGSLSEVFDAESQAKARLRLARIYSEELGRDDQAIKQLEEAADGGLTEPQLALSRLVALYEKAQRFPDIDRTLARQIDATLEPSQSVPLRLRRAELAVSHFKKPKDALELYRAVLDDDRQNQAATDALSRLAEDEALRGQVVEILEPIYQERGDEESLSHLYEAELEILPRGGDRDRRLEQLAELYKGRLQSPTRAFFTLSRSFVDHPDEDSLLGELEQLSTQHRFEDELAVLLGEVLSAAPPLEIKGEAKKPAPVKPGLPAARPGLAAPARPVASPLAAKKPQAAAAPQRASLAPPPTLSQDVARELRLRLARLAKGPVEDAERALSLYQDVLKEDPEHQEALEAVIDLYEPTGRFAELADALLKRAEPEFELPKRRALLGKAATLYSEKLNEPKKALAAWKKIIEGDDSDLEARSAQEQLLETLGEFAALAESLSSHILFVEDNAQAAELIYRRGVILEQKLKKPKEAMDAFREALDRSQNHEPALIALERLYDAQGKHQDLQELLLRRLDELQGADRAPTLVRLAHLAEERFKSRADATQYYRDALAVAPNHPEANAGLLRLLEADGNWQEVVSRLNARISEAPSEAPALYLRLGEIYEQRMKDEAAAISAFRQALDVAPGNNAALVALARLHEKRGEWDDVTRIFEVVIEGSQGEAKLDLAISTANLHHSKRNDAASAERVLNSVATRPAIQPKILQALRDLFTKESAWTKLAELVALDAEIQTETPKKLQALLEAAKLIQEKQKDPLAALPYMEKAHALDANLLPQLADLYLATGRLAEASQAFEKMFAAHKAARRNKDAAKCMQRLGAIAEKAGDLKTAQEKFKSAYESDPSNPEILASYGNLLFKNQEIEPATKIFRALLLIPPGATPPMPKPEIYLRLGQLNAMSGQPQKAIDMFKRGLEFDSQNAALKEALASVTAPK